MRLSELEHALRSLIDRTSVQGTLAALGRNERLATVEGGEFSAAAYSLTSRMQRPALDDPPEDPGRPWF
jgi:hypothetical protein